MIGIAMISAAVAFNATKDGLVKLMIGDFSPLFLIWAQVSFTALVLVPVIVFMYGPAVLRPKPLFPQVFRSAVLVSAVFLFYWSLEYIPLADSTAMIFIAPILVTALSPFILGEKIGPRRWAAVIIGFVGVLIILRPDFSGERIGYFIALGCGIFLSFFYMYNRKLSSHTPPLVAAAYTSAIGSLILMPMAPFVWTTPDIAHASLLGWFFVLSTLGQTLMVISFRFGPASTLAPFQYIQLLTAVTFGYVVFGTLPDFWTWTGIALIAGAGLFIVWRERRSLGAEETAAV